MHVKSDMLLMFVTIEERQMTNTYQFTLILDGVDDTTPNLEDILFGAGCDDALINFKNGTVYLDFDRESENLEEAVISAIKDIESAIVGAKVVSVAPEHLVSLTDIGERISLTRQAISLYILGQRGKGGFPKPVLKINNKSPLWKWSSVAEWFYQQGKISDHSIIDFANILEEINIALELRNEKVFTHSRQILGRLM